MRRVHRARGAGEIRRRVMPVNAARIRHGRRNGTVAGYRTVALEVICRRTHPGKPMFRGVGPRVSRFVRLGLAGVAVPLLVAATRRPPEPPATRSVLAAAPSRSVWDSVFTAEQAKRGQATYKLTCAKCHLETLAGLDDSPALTGAAFLAKWYGQTLGDLQDRIRTTMPSDDPGTLSRPHITDVIAYLLSFNNFPAGKSELSPALDSLSIVRIEASKP